MSMIYDLIVVGSGAAGLAAAVYAGRYRMKTLVIGDSFGGYTSIAGPIENYPGHQKIDGFDLMQIMRTQGESIGAEVVDGKAIDAQNNNGCFSVTLDTGASHQASTLIIATGTEHKRLGLANEHELTSKGVHYCVTCDGPLYGGKTIIVIGGGDTSIKGVNLAAEYAAKIYLVVRGSQIKAEPINYEQMKKLGDKVEVLFETAVKEIKGKERFENIVLSKEYNGSSELSADGLFIEIGALPRTEIAQKLGIALDARGYIQPDPLMRTSVPGIFAAGDVMDLFGGFKQDITAACMGAVAATSAYNYYKIHGDLCMVHLKPQKV